MGGTLIAWSCKIAYSLARVYMATKPIRIVIYLQCFLPIELLFGPAVLQDQMTN